VARVTPEYCAATPHSIYSGEIPLNLGRVTRDSPSPWGGTGEGREFVPKIAIRAPL